MSYQKEDYTLDAKQRRFERLAALRTNLVLNRLDVLGNCANKHLYHYEQREVDKIFQHIEEKTKMVKAKFSGKQREQFKF